MEPVLRVSSSDFSFWLLILWLLPMFQEQFSIQGFVFLPAADTGYGRSA